jgi:hypothetical protein
MTSHISPEDLLHLLFLGKAHDILDVLISTEAGRHLDYDIGLRIDVRNLTLKTMT